MPTFTSVAWEALLEPRLRESYGGSLSSKQRTTKSDDDGDCKERKKARPPNHIYISPALYATPEPTPIPESAVGSLSPSPYVVTRKRHGGGRGRGGCGGDSSGRRVAGFEIEEKQGWAVGDDGGESRCGDVEGVSEVKFSPELQLPEEGEEVPDELGGAGIVECRNESSVSEDDFLDTRCDSLSVSSSIELNGFGNQAENILATPNWGEFFDANEDFSTELSASNVPSYDPNIELELRMTKISLLEEIERRKTSEDALGQMCSQWQRVCDHLSAAGLTFPTPSNVQNMQLDIDPVEQFSQELLVARFVAEAIGRGEARAEVELAAEAIFESKDQEISRLRDRLQYYETINHEMSQRNQEIIEVARRKRQRKRSLRRRWFWSCLGLSVVVGISVIACSYLPEGSRYRRLLAPRNSSDATSSSSSKSA